nr:MAG TPA: hypothetical protein [Caudoviricetes sp.]
MQKRLKLINLFYFHIVFYVLLTFSLHFYYILSHFLYYVNKLV